MASRDKRSHKAPQHFRKAHSIRIPKVLQVDWKETQTNVSAGKNDRTYETMESWDKSARGPRVTHKMTPQERQAQFRSSVMLFIQHLEDPTRYRRVSILNLDKLTVLA